MTGLRISEALNLLSTDVDWTEGILTIRASKFGKSRLIPLHGSSLKILSDYDARRDAVESSTSFPDRLAFAELRPPTDPACTTFVIALQSRRCCAGIAPGKMCSGAYPFCRRISVTDMSPTPTGM